MRYALEIKSPPGGRPKAPPAIAVKSSQPLLKNQVLKIFLNFFEFSYA